MNRYDDYETAKHFKRVGEQPRKMFLKASKNEFAKEHDGDGVSHSGYNRKGNKNVLRAALPILQSRLHH